MTFDAYVPMVATVEWPTNAEGHSMNNSKDPDFDWHKTGIYVMYSPENRPLFSTLDATAWGCRAEMIRNDGPGWSKLAERGYYVQEVGPI